MRQSNRPFPIRWSWMITVGILLIAQPFRPALCFAETVPPLEPAAPAVTDLAMAVPASPALETQPQGNEVPAEGPSLAERIGSLQQTVKTDLAQLEALQAKLKEQDEEQEDASAEFQERDVEFEKQQELLKAAETGTDATQVGALTELVKKVEGKWALARERFDLAIEAKKTSQQQIAELKAKVHREQETLDKLLAPEVAEQESGTSAEQPSNKTAAPTSGSEASVPSPTAVTTQINPISGTTSAANAPQSDATGVAGEPELPKTEELVKAEEQVSQAQAAKEQAEQEAESVAHDLESLDRSISLEQKAREAARRQGTNAEARIDVLEEELRQAIENGADLAAVQKMRKQIREAQQRIHESRAEVKERALRLDTLQAERVDLLREQVTTLQQVEKARQEAETARLALDTIKNPFTLRNLSKWLVEKGPKLLAIVLAALLLHLLVNLLTGRIVTYLGGKEAKGSRRDREQRASTLVGVLHNTSIVINYVGAVLAALDVAGLPIAPLLGGAAVVGLAVAFAAQNLLKDYFCGFMILMEDQYNVNDVVKIGGVTGLVERVTLRVTVVRDLEAVHFIPHGTISSVSNLTHKWSRAVFEIGVAYSEDVDRVMDVLVTLGKEMRSDSVFGPFILDDPEMLGLDSFGDSAIVVKFFIKTKPLKQWMVKRELNRRIKNKFDELNIEIPFPHRTVYHRVDQNEAAGVLEQLQANSISKAA